MPRIILSASGRATGGRVLHHLKALAPDARNTVLLTGFQAAGTRGADLKAGARQLSIHGQRVEVRAEVESLDLLSAHADALEILAWLRQFEQPPQETFVIHGEVGAATALAARMGRICAGMSVCRPMARPRRLGRTPDCRLEAKPQSSSARSTLPRYTGTWDPGWSGLRNDAC